MSSDDDTREAAFQATWVALYRAALSPPQRHQRPSEYTYSRHMDMVNNTQRWFLSPLVIRDSQQTIQWAHGDLVVISTFQQALTQFNNLLDTIVDDLLKGCY